MNKEDRETRAKSIEKKKMGGEKRSEILLIDCEDVETVTRG